MPDTPSSQANITIYHNPKCGTSRNVLAMIQNSGEEPNVVEYLKTPLNAEQLQALVHKLGIPVRDLLRQKGTPYDELGLGEAHWTDEQLIEQMATHPILMNRPVVVTPLGAKLCRPSETVLEILPNAQQGGFTKEDGEVVVPGKQANA
jgi:arsenate reductase (glutaredoxin)